MEEVKQSASYNGSRTYSIYRTDTVYLVFAVMISIAGVVSVMVTFYGRWHLGRHVSMNPLEVCKAFRAPILEEAGSDVSLPANLKNLRVIYGFLDHGRASGYVSNLETQSLADN